MVAKLSQLDFECRSSSIHNNKYDYSKSIYAGNNIKLVILCHEHGEFSQTPHSHMHGRGCPKCGRTSQTLKRTTPFDVFVEQANVVHNKLYEYNTPSNIDANSSVVITCAEHGEFTQSRASHLNGRGCPKCGRLKAAKNTRKTTEVFLKKAKKVHGDKYDYSEVDYELGHSNINIKCRTHGVFQQTPSSHLHGRGCPICIGKNKTTENFVDSASNIHNNKYTYFKSDYAGKENKILITCKKHGDFWQRAGDHIYKKAGCPQCSIHASQGEVELSQFITDLCFVTNTRNKQIIKPYELDIVIPEKKLAIEYNGLRFHSDAFPNARSRHKDKSDLCTKAGYKLIHIYEDDWLYNKEVVKKTLKHILGVSEEKLYARKLQVKQMLHTDTKEFFETHHMQGSSKGGQVWCLTHDDKVVAAMQFRMSSSERGKNDTTRWELIRFATSSQIVGGASKLFEAFLRDNPDVQTIISYSDNDMFTGKMYEILGFEFEHETDPDYKVIVRGKRYHKANFKKSKIAANYPDVYDQNLTEKEMCHKLGFYRIYNSGLTKWIYTRTKQC